MRCKKSGTKPDQLSVSLEYLSYKKATGYNECNKPGVTAG
jgi:hypothetical protein